MRKRGQIYLLAAVIFGFVLFILILPSNVVQEPASADAFLALAQNFDRESAKFLNYLLQDNKPVENAFLNFTILFTSYSKTKNPDFGLFYTFLHEKNLYIGNYLHYPVTYTFQGATGTFSGCFQQIQTSISLVGLQLPITASYAQLATCQKVFIATAPWPSLDLIIHDPAGDIPLHFEVASGTPDVIIVSREQRADAQKVYLKGTFI